MILSFVAGGSIVFVRVDDERVISFSSDNTNNQFVSLRSLSEQTGQDTADVQLVEVILKHLPSEYVEQYVVSEFGRLGLEYKGVVSEEEYASISVH